MLVRSTEFKVNARNIFVNSLNCKSIGIELSTCIFVIENIDVSIEILELECRLGHVMRSHNVYSKW